MNGKGLTLAGLVTLLGALALHGSKLIEAATGAWLFAVKITETAPLGLWSAAATLGVCVAIQGLLSQLVARAEHNPDARALWIKIITAALGVGLMMWQMAEKPTQGLLAGLFVGLVAPALWNVIAATTRWLSRSTGIGQDDPPGPFA